ncbi:mitochondrial import inner membrane translocase subunit Tim29 isoform X2 [Bombyx mandarina]|uniref:Mitochondrial import inner membrane translocase subunit Tim29 isoform X1 n=1 Tax=Bombyx mandarina TaxID=7092 RepID=A0A6J2JPB7_BOMMA|nr:mitochondrial import inner membrane translocase subunit Tim29 isoform X1 [Bombyx mandarina]XP_028031429.1 mitochondrial import inner membrane translocase subunit Tim29 isoform X2 [Bombyx mandarina]
MLRSIYKVSGTVQNISTKVKFPEKFKGTIIEKWADYWKNLFIDYRQMLQDLRSDIQDDPMKAMKWTTGIITFYVLSRNNPTECDFKDNLKIINNEVGLVSEECLNPKAVEHLRFLDTCYNQEVIHYRSLGILSVMYTSELSNSCDLYRAHCTYTKPTYFSFPSRIVDIGFMGKWWNLFIKSTNYDVNY